MSRKRSAIHRWLPTALTILALTGCQPETEEQPVLLVFAAASMSDVLTEIGDDFEKRHGLPVDFNFGGSNMLAEQILRGAPANIYLSANEAQIRRLVERGKIRMAAAIPLLGNSLVVVVSERSELQTLEAPADLAAFERCAIADPAAVPVGVYARQWLEREGLWTEIAPKVVAQLDTRAALGAVMNGHLPVGIVYATDAATTEKVRVVYRVPPERIPPIRYYATPVPDQPHSDVEAFFGYLQSAEAERLFLRYGFNFLPEASTE